MKSGRPVCFGGVCGWISVLMIVLIPWVTVGTQESYFDAERLSPRKGEPQRPERHTTRRAEKRPVQAESVRKQDAQVPAKKPDPEQNKNERTAVATEDKPGNQSTTWQPDLVIYSLAHVSQSRLPDSAPFPAVLAANRTWLRPSLQWEPDWGWNFMGALDLDTVFSNYQQSPEFEHYWSAQGSSLWLPLAIRQRAATYQLGAGFQRLYAGWRGRHFQFRLGRQELDWGHSPLIRPLDLFTPTGPFTINPEDVQAADLLHAEWIFGQRLQLQYTGGFVPAHSSRAAGSPRAQDLNSIWRASGQAGKWKYALLGGQHTRDPVLAGELTYAPGDFELYTAWLGWLGDGSRNQQLVSLGLRRDLLQNLESRLELIANSSPDTSSSARGSWAPANAQPPLPAYPSARGDQAYSNASPTEFMKAPLLVQLLFNYQWSDDLKSAFLCIGDPDGKTVFTGLSLTWNVFEQSTLRAGIWYFDDLNRDDAGEYSRRPSSLYLSYGWRF
ncbi:MAG: hypothetical protein KDK39_06680 [Leptospiraceae bacterium]|nr:hypothetical protein [Leptospiraceae bacterium]